MTTSSTTNLSDLLSSSVSGTAAGRILQLAGFEAFFQLPVTCRGCLTSLKACEPLVVSSLLSQLVGPSLVLDFPVKALMVHGSPLEKETKMQETEKERELRQKEDEERGNGERNPTSTLWQSLARVVAPLQRLERQMERENLFLPPILKAWVLLESLKKQGRANPFTDDKEETGENVRLAPFARDALRCISVSSMEDEEEMEEEEGDEGMGGEGESLRGLGFVRFFAAERTGEDLTLLGLWLPHACPVKAQGLIHLSSLDTSTAGHMRRDRGGGREAEGLYRPDTEQHKDASLFPLRPSPPCSSRLKRGGGSVSGEGQPEGGRERECLFWTRGGPPPGLPSHSSLSKGRPGESLGGDKEKEGGKERRRGDLSACAVVAWHVWHHVGRLRSANAEEFIFRTAAESCGGGNTSSYLAELRDMWSHAEVARPTVRVPGEQSPRETRGGGLIERDLAPDEEDLFDEEQWASAIRYALTSLGSVRDFEEWKWNEMDFVQDENGKEGGERHCGDAEAETSDGDVSASAGASAARERLGGLRVGMERCRGLCVM
uniref:Uncharacterized protein n=1 Tax=Chromera velia CCMP2878 TaxID=1169474 RepID=A0A0G4GBE6_9ALVE|eukprot:Cvel_21004.t1-p1 / transcript=Cvel_21004.t1 / gene=Cvel_21004 / organism=Chromera_velia_CCMP2878 / gene_product=hypothetical protein / transcript_product=hypothetical protein / location=Cvel_scaffold1935:7095-10330(+) / protein_length=546 / sequence_SO=supercontig / SO=protein_coding / is_pseudo=false